MSKYQCVAGVMAPKEKNPTNRRRGPSKLFKPGEILPDDFPAAILKDHIDSGFVVEISDGGVVLAKNMPPIDMSGRWNLNPADLQKRTLRALNVLVAERDASVAMFEDKEMAIRHLSQDWRG